MKKILLVIILFLFVSSVKADTCSLNDTELGFCLKGIDQTTDEIKGTDYFASDLSDAENSIRPGRTFFKVSSDNKLLYCSNGLLSTNLLNDEYEEIDKNCVVKSKNKNSLIYSYVYGFNKNTKASGYEYNNRYLSGNSFEDYYITQTAVWHFSPPNSEDSKWTTDWFANYNFENKTYYGKTDDTITKISNLINDAMSASNASPSLSISSNKTAMGISGDFYISDAITIRGNYLTDKVTVSISGLNDAFVTRDRNAASGSSSITLFDGLGSSVSDTVYVKVPINKITKENNNIVVRANSKTVFNDNSKIIECHPSKDNESNPQQPLVNYKLVDSNLSDEFNLTVSKFSITISKKDNQDNFLEGAKFILKKGNETITNWTTTKSEKNILLVPGEYTLIEDSSPEGYIKNNNTITFTVSDTGIVTVNNKQVNEIEIINNPIEITISKIKVNGQDELAGATLRITDESGTVAKDINGDNMEWITTDEPKLFHVKRGEYRLEEVASPSGYKLSENVVYFTVNEDGTVTIGNTTADNNLIVFSNEPIKVTISKREILKSEELPGAHLRIIDQNGNTAKDISGNELSWTSTNSPKVFHIAAGTYILEEIVAPKGYELTEQRIVFTVNIDGTVMINNEAIENNFIILENIPEPEDVKTGNILLYVALSSIISAIAVIILFLFKKKKRI